MKIKLSYIILLVIAVLMANCRTKKIASDNKNIALNTTTIKANISDKEIEKLNETITKDIKTIDIPNAQAVFTQDSRQYSIKIAMSIIKDKEINVSVRPILGVEIYRLRLTPERIYIFDRLKKVYSDSGYDFFNKISNSDLDFSYNTIESIFLNKIFTLKGKSISNKYKVEPKTDRYILKSVDAIYENYTHLFEIASNFTVISTKLTDDSNNVLTEVSYNNPIFKDKHLFYTNIKIETKNAKRKDQNSTIDIEIKKIEFDKKIVPSEINLNRYKKVDINDLF